MQSLVYPCYFLVPKAWAQRQFADRGITDSLERSEIGRKSKHVGLVDGSNHPKTVLKFRKVVVVNLESRRGRVVSGAAALYLPVGVSELEFGQSTQREHVTRPGGRSPRQLYVVRPTKCTQFVKKCCAQFACDTPSLECSLQISARMPCTSPNTWQLPDRPVYDSVDMV